MGPPKPNQDRASGPQEKGGTSQLTATPPHPRSFECQRSQGWAHCMRQSPGPGACGHVAPSVGLVPLPSVCSVPMGGRPAGPGVTHTPGTLTSLPLPLPSPPQVLLSPRPWHSPPQQSLPGSYVPCIPPARCITFGLRLLSERTLSSCPHVCLPK